MRKPSRPIETFANSVAGKAKLHKRMMDVLAVVVLAMSMADILFHRKRRDVYATSI